MARSIYDVHLLEMSDKMIRWTLTFILSGIALVAIIFERYLSLKFVFRQITESERVNLKYAIGVGSLLFVAGMALIGILLLWNSQARNLLDVLIILNAIISLLDGISLASPSWLSRWWINAYRKRNH